MGSNDICSALRSSVSRSSVCLVCGDKGIVKLLIYCGKCRDSAVHHYCMDNVSPDDDNINWTCWDCAPKVIINEPIRKSERICPKRRKLLETRNHRKGLLNQKKKLIQISNEVNGIGQTATDLHSPIRDVDSQSLHEGQSDLDTLEEKKSIPEIPSHSIEHNESIQINEIGTLPTKKENSMQSLDETEKIHEVTSLVGDDHCVSPQKPSLEPDDGILAEPETDPKWRGWFNINEEEDEDDACEILAYLSSKASSKVSDAVTEMPHTLDIQILDKNVVWPKHFMVSPPTANSLGLYFFPARERDERSYDILMEEVMEKELALKAVFSNLELLIFSSYELPLEHRRFNGKYFFWGVFKQKPQSCSPSKAATTACQKKGSENFGHCEPTAEMKSPIPSTNSSQASNMPPSVHNTPRLRKFGLGRSPNAAAEVV